MKKVLLVFGNLERAGAQLRTLETCQALRERYPIQFDFCTLGRRPIELQAEIQRIGGNIYCTPIRYPGFIIRFSSLLRRGQYDIVNTEPYLISGIVVWLAKKHRVPTRIASLRNSVGNRKGMRSNPLFIWLMRTLVKRNATHIVGVSRAALNSVFPLSWQSVNDFRIIYNGLSLFPFQGAEKRCEVRKEFGWPLDSRIVINVARLSRQKNHRAILETIRLVYEYQPNIRLLLVGDGELRDEVTGVVDESGLKDICAMAGVRTDVPRLLLASDVFLFPSLWEGLPGALLEALAAGLTVVTSDIPPMQEIVKYFPASMLMAPPNDVEQHAEHIVAALDNTPINRASAQQQFANTPFILENSIEAYGNLYGLMDVKDESNQ